MAIYEVRRGDNLYNIVKNQYGLTNKSEIMKKVREVAQNNGIKNPNLIFTGQKLNLAEQLTLNQVNISRGEAVLPPLKDETGNTNFYRSTSIFGDIATKKYQYPDQPFIESKLKQITQDSEEVEDVELDVTPSFTSETSRDLQAFDIAAKPAGVGGFSQMNGTDAYNMFLQVNADDFTVRETEYKGKKELKAYLDKSKSDGKIKAFSSEIRNGKEYLAIRDNEGKVHFYDMENKLQEVQFDE